MTEHEKKPLIALTGAVQLELFASYFREAGYELAKPDEIPDITFDVTAYDSVLASEVEGFYDARLQTLAGCPYSIVGIRAIVDEFKWWQLRSSKKVLAIDADNTLWDGILSEDGRDALKQRTELQSGIAALAGDGVIVVIVSKNDSGTVHFDWATLEKVNWEPKAGNLIEACKELNVGIDSVVFVDDNPHERAQMASHLPEVVIAPWNGWKGIAGEERQLIRRLKEYFFSQTGQTEEDRLRAVDYKRRFATKDEYLGDLGLWVKPSPAKIVDLDRLVQMAGKTNQFNATTIRRTREELSSLLGRTYVFRAGDKFGEQGIVVYVIIDETGKRLTDFVMSCRAMGRTLEHFVYEWIVKQLGVRPKIDFRATEKNAPFAKFLTEVEKGDELKTWYKESK